jgi:polyketide synthase Type III
MSFGREIVPSIEGDHCRSWHRESTEVLFSERVTEAIRGDGPSDPIRVSEQCYRSPLSIPVWRQRGWVTSKRDSRPIVEETPHVRDRDRYAGDSIVLRQLKRHHVQRLLSLLCDHDGFAHSGGKCIHMSRTRSDAKLLRLDVVGMGCNGGLNALNATSSWTLANPGKLAVMLCVEICSAAYVIDDTLRTGVVNSLFGDGAAALALRATDVREAATGPSILKFHSCIITEAIDAMRYDWDESHGKFSFFLDPQIPYVIGANIETTIDGLLLGTGVRRSDISHWLVHSGGKKVIDSIKVNLGLSAYDVRHTTSVLRDYGNVSSGSFIFSYQRLLKEGKFLPGDYGVMITMGPGSTIESALLQW